MAIVIPYTKQTWTDGSGGGTPVSAARLGVLEEGIFDVSYSPAVRVTHNAAQAIGAATETTLAFNTERFDQAANAADTMHDTAVNNSRLTCRYAGVYQITGGIEWATTSTDQYVAIRLNGVTTIMRQRNPAGSGSNPAQTITTLYSLAVNDYVELRVFSASAMNVNSSGNYSPEFMMVRVA